MPKGSEARRINAIEALDAKVIVTEMNYDDTVRHAADYATKNGFYLVQDTALPDYEKVPMDVVLGYTTMAQEALNQIPEKPTHVFVQAGVGSMAGGIIGLLNHLYHEKLPFIGVMEASSVACIYESVKQDTMICIGGEPYTAMAGLNCGEANPLVFPLIKAASSCFIKCEDDLTFRGMDRAKHPVGDDPSFSSGESGAVGLGLMESILSNPDYTEIKAAMKLDENSLVLLFSTEGEL
jgi:diaminopropionate ammonia-lyase